MKASHLQYFNLTLLLCLFLSACGDGPDASQIQPSNDLSSSASEDPILNIQKRYNTINNWLTSATLSMDSFPYTCEANAGGGQVKYFRQNGELVMLRHDFYEGDHAGTTEIYYLHNERPIFIFVESSSWSFGGPASDDPSIPHTIDNVTENRYYFTNYEAGIGQQSLKCLQKDYVIRSWIEIPLNKNQIPNKDIECSSNAIDYLNRFKALESKNLSDIGC